VFFDELERIGRHKNSAMTLVKIRLRAYYEFRDRSEALQRVGHISGPRRTVVPIADGLDTRLLSGMSLRQAAA
jgi:hypothetical protein